MYFAFLAHYTKWLVSASLVGCAFFVYLLCVAFDERKEHGMLLFAMFISLWAVAMLEAWKNRCVMRRYDWYCYARVPLLVLLLLLLLPPPPPPRPPPPANQPLASLGRSRWPWSGA